MTVDDALYEMELVGHDFFLFHDKESDRPCVVYRRHAYDYGIDSPEPDLAWPDALASHFDVSPRMDARLIRRRDPSTHRGNKRAR